MTIRARDNGLTVTARAPSVRRTTVGRVARRGLTGQPVLTDDGSQLLLPMGATLRICRLGGRMEAVLPDDRAVSAPGEIVRILPAPDGTVFLICQRTDYASESQRHLLCVLRDREIAQVCPLAVVPADAVVTRHYVAIVTRGSPAAPAELLILDRRTGRLRQREALTAPVARLARGRDDEILVSDPSIGLTRYIHLQRRMERCPPDRGTPQPIPPGPGRDGPGRDRPRPKPECCVCCKPMGGPDDGGAGDPGADPGGRDPGGRDPGRPPEDDCVPGDGGDVDDCFIYVHAGFSILCRNICLPGDPGCGRQLDFDLGEVRRLCRGLAVVSRDRRQFMLLDPESLAGLHRERLDEDTVVLTARRRDEVLFLRPDGELTLLDPTPVLPALVPELDLGLEANERVYQGQSPLLQWEPGGAQTGVRRVLIIPVMEPGQAFDGTIGAYFNQPDLVDALDAVSSYFRECSHLDLGADGLDVQFRVFGRDTPTLYSGPPVQIDEPFDAFWNDGWQPGGIDSEVELPADRMVVFDGDERLTLETFTQIPAENSTFDFVFPAASFRVRIPASASGYVLDFGAGGTSRSFTLGGTDRDGNTFTVSASAAGISPALPDIVIGTRADIPGALGEIAAAIDAMLDTVAGQPFAAPRVVWQDDGVEWGLLHVTFRFAGAGGAPVADVVACDDLFLNEFPPASQSNIPAGFDMGADADVALFTNYLNRVLADGMANDQGAVDFSRTQIDLAGGVRPPVVAVNGSTLTINIRLSPDYGRSLDEQADPARIERVSQTGLAKIGMDAAQPFEGDDTKLSGGGGPTLERARALYNQVYTKMIDAIVADQPGPEQTRIDRADAAFNCVGLFDLECSFAFLHNFVVVPVHPAPDGTGADREPAVAGLRANANKEEMRDIGPTAGPRTIAAQTIESNRRKLFTRLRFSTADDTDRHLRDAAVLAHELGHGILGYKDQYPGDQYRDDLVYVQGYDLMDDEDFFPHMSSYHKRISGWLGDGAVTMIGRPPEDEPVDRTVVLVQLEGWDPGGIETLRALAQNLLPDVGGTVPVVASVVFRLGGDGHVFNILELRGPGARFSQALTPPRLVMFNAVDPRDSTRYGVGLDDPDTPQDEGETGEAVILRYRRQLHLMDDQVMTPLASGAAEAPENTYDAGTHPETPEVGLKYSLLDLVQANLNGQFVSLARVRLNWVRNRAINLGFRDSLPDWQSRDIAVILPEDVPEDGLAPFPEDQDPESLEYFRVPPADQSPLRHQVLVQVHNFGDADAFSVEVELLGRLPYGAGDWTRDPFGTDPFPPKLIETIPAGGSAVVGFDLLVRRVEDTHLCLRAQIGDRDPEPGTSDDTDPMNSWAQQNVFLEEAPAESPPAPVVTTFSVTNAGPFVEEVYLAPRGLGPGARLTVSPALLRIPGRSRGIFRLRMELEERLLEARCGKDVTFLLDAWRRDDHAFQIWGTSKFQVRPRIATRIQLTGSLVPGTGVHLTGAVTPDVGAERFLLHVVFPDTEPMWLSQVLGPGSTFDRLVPGPLVVNEEVLATAYFDGSDTHARSVSATLRLTSTQAG